MPFSIRKRIDILVIKMEISRFVLVPKIVELHTNVSTIPGFKFGFRFCKCNNIGEEYSKCKIKIHYLVQKNIDISHSDSIKYREMIIRDNKQFLFKKKLFSILRLKLLLDIKNESPIIKVNKIYHLLWRSSIGHIYPPGVVLHNILGMYLVLNGFIPICFSAVEIYGRSFILIGISGSGKTELICRVIKDGGKVIADDNLVIDKNGGIYGCIFLASHAKNLKPIYAHLKNKENRISSLFKSPLTLFDAFGQKNVSLTGEVEGVVFLERGKPRLKDISVEDGLNKIAILNKGNYFYETIPVTQALMTFNDKFSKIRNREEKILEKALGGCRMAVIRGDSPKRLFDLFIRFARRENT